MRKMFVLFIAVSLCLCQSKSQTYFVDIENGNDTLPGTIFQPWQKLDTAINRLSAGDTLLIRRGDYTSLGQITFQKEGTSAKPITIRGYQNEYPLISGITIGYSNWLTIEKLEFSGPQVIPSGWKDMDNVVIDQDISIDPSMKWDEQEGTSTVYRVDEVLKKYSTYAMFFNYGRNSTVTWESNPSTGINIVNSSNLVIKNNKIHNHTYGIRLRNESKNILADANEIYYCVDGLSAYCDTANYTYSFGHSTVSNNSIYQSFRNGIMLNYGANHIRVDGNQVRFSGQNHISTYNLDIKSDSAGYNTISNNEVTNGGYYSEFMHYPGSSAISIHSPGPECKVIGNYIAYQVDSTLRDGNGLISDNNPQGSEFINNVCYKVMGSGINITLSNNNKVIHNTIIEAGFKTLSQKNGVSVRIIDVNDTANIIANNIFFNSKNGGILAEGKNLEKQKYIDYNLYFFENGASVAGNGLLTGTKFDNVPYITFETNGIIAKPLADSTGALSKGSPAIAHGTPDYSYPVDKSGIKRSMSKPTIGAYETEGSTAIGESFDIHEKSVVFPNPVKNVLMVEAISQLGSGKEVFTIFSIDGKLIYLKPLDNSKQNLIPVNDFLPGIYFFRYGKQSGEFVKY